MTPALAEGGREAFHPPRAAARSVRRHRQRHLSRPASARATRRICSRTSTSRRSVPEASASSSTTGTPPRRSCCRSCSARSRWRRSPRTASRPRQARATRRLRESIGQAGALVSAIGADLGAVFDRAGERLFLIDEQGHEISERADAPAVPRADRRRRAERQGRGADHGHRASRGARRRGGLELVRTPGRARAS